jgi:hypothetical protein
MPAGVQAVEDLLPTGSGLLVSHRDGLSVWRAGSWSLCPAPKDDGPACQGWKSSLTRSGKDIWWQALPGQLVKVRPDGTLGEPAHWELPPEDPFARDARLLRVIGADPAGSLWFVLASPAPAPPPAAPQEPGVQAPGAQAPPDPGADWALYAAAGLDRLYRWNPARKTLERMVLKQAWAALGLPPALPPPDLGQDLVPASGTLLPVGAGSAWWLPLGALPFERLQAR